MLAMLTPQETAIFDLEVKWWRHAGSKEQAIRGLGMSTTAYYQQLNRLLDRPDALEANPALVRRLRRIRSQRFQQRGAHAS